MRGWRTIAVAMAKGFVRDRTTLVGPVPLLQQLPKDAKTAFDESFSVEKSTDRSGTLERVRTGKVDAAVEQKDDRLVLHFSRADQVKAATVQATMRAFVQGANQAATGEPPKFSLDAKSVEDSSVKGIQYVTPGILGWAIATSAAFGASLTLVTWRQNELLRRLRLAPVSTGSLVSARVVVTVAVAFVQFVIFVGLAMVLFGLQLTGSWWMALPLVRAGTLTFMAIGLLTGSLTSSSEAASAANNLIVLPVAFLSGSFIPLDIAPSWIQSVSYIFPLRYLNEGMLDVMVRGDGPASAILPIGIMLAFTVVITAVAARFFRWDAANYAGVFARAHAQEAPGFGAPELFDA